METRNMTKPSGGIGRKADTFSADNAVKQALRRGEWITDYTADRKYGCRRWRTLRSELIQAGWDIYDEWQKGRNSKGKHTHWKRYRLIKAGA